MICLNIVILLTLLNRDGGIKGIFGLLDSSLIEEGGEKKLNEIVNSLKTPLATPPSPPSFSFAASYALLISIPYLSSSKSEAPNQTTWVQKGAALTIQRYYRHYKQRKGEKKFIKLGFNGGLSLSFTAKWWTPKSESIKRDEEAIKYHCVPAVLAYQLRMSNEQKEREEREIQERLKRERKHANMLKKRWELVQQHPISMPGIGTSISLSFSLFIFYYYLKHFLKCTHIIMKRNLFDS